MKKFFSLFLVMILILNFVSFSYADTVNTIDRLIDVDPKNPETIENSEDTSGDEQPFESEDKDEGTLNLGILTPVWGIIDAIFSAIPKTLANLIYLLPTIDGIIFNTNNIFNITIFDSNPSNLAGSLQSTISAIYNAFRYLVTAVYIVVLVYLAIRMMLSSIGRQKAKYKELFKYWLIGLLLLFSFHWVMAFFVWISNEIVKILSTIAVDLLKDNTYEDLVKDLPAVAKIVAQSADAMKNYPTTNYIVNKIIYNTPTVGGMLSTLLLPFTGTVFIILLLWSSLSIIITYFKRLFTVLVLILLFPIVVLSYVFDKIGDRKAQTFSLWLKEFVTNVMIQPIHALILTFIAIILAKSSEIPFLSNNTFFAPIFCLLALRLIPMGEELLKKLFQISSQMGPGARGIAGSMAQAGMALRGAKDMTRSLTQPFSNMKKRRDIKQQRKNELDAYQEQGLSKAEARKKHRENLRKDYKANNINSHTKSAAMFAGSLAGFGSAITGAGSGQYLSKALTSATLGSAIAGGLVGMPKKLDEFFRGDATKAEDFEKRAKSLESMTEEQAKKVPSEFKKQIAIDLGISLGQVEEMLASKQGRKDLAKAYSQSGNALKWGASVEQARKLNHINMGQSALDKALRNGEFDPNNLSDQNLYARKDGIYIKNNSGKSLRVSTRSIPGLKDGEELVLSSEDRGKSIDEVVKNRLSKDPKYAELLSKISPDKQEELNNAYDRLETAKNKLNKLPSDATDTERKAAIREKREAEKDYYSLRDKFRSAESDIKGMEKEKRSGLLESDELAVRLGYEPVYTETFLRNINPTQEPEVELDSSGTKAKFYYESNGTKYYTAEIDNSEQKTKLVDANTELNKAMNLYGVSVDEANQEIATARTTLQQVETQHGTINQIQVQLDSARSQLQRAQVEFDTAKANFDAINNIPGPDKNIVELANANAIMQAAQVKLNQCSSNVTAAEQKLQVVVDAHATFDDVQANVQPVLDAKVAFDKAQEEFNRANTQFVQDCVTNNGNVQIAPNENVASFLWNEVSSTQGSAVSQVNTILDDYQRNPVANPLPSNFNQLESQAMQEIGNSIDNYSSNPDSVYSSATAGGNASAISGAFVFNSATQDNVGVPTISISSLSSVGNHGDLFSYGICDEITDLLKKWSTTGLIYITFVRNGSGLDYNVFNKFSKQAIETNNISIDDSFQNDRLSNDGDSLTIIFDNGQWYQIQQ